MNEINMIGVHDKTVPRFVGLCRAEKKVRFI